MWIEKQSIKFRKGGCLKVGIHDCTLTELRALTFTNNHRRALGYKLLNFLCWPILSRRFSHAYLGGGFLSTTPFPVDIDLVLETKEPFGPKAFKAIEPFFLTGLKNVLDIYSIDLHFWMEGAPNSLADYRSFFQ